MVGSSQALARSGQVGYSTCVGELEELSNGVSAAVLDAASGPMVIVNIWGPSQRVTRERLPTLGQIALSTAHEISLALR